MRLDHIAYRTKDRHKCADFFVTAFGYKVQQEFELTFGDGKVVKSIALEPPEKLIQGLDWGVTVPGLVPETAVDYHLAPEIFISSGEEGSIVHDWVLKWGNGIGGIHHMAYQIEDVRAVAKLWIEKGWAEFTTKDILTCPDDELHQIFTKPNPYTGIIYEFIRRGKFGFCSANVKALMESTKGL